MKHLEEHPATLRGQNFNQPNGSLFQTFMGNPTTFRAKMEVKTPRNNQQNSCHGLLFVFTCGKLMGFCPQTLRVYKWYTYYLSIYATYIYIQINTMQNKIPTWMFCFCCLLSLSTSKNQKLTAPFCVAFPCPGTSYQQRGKARGLTKSSLSEFLREALCELYPYKCHLVGGWTKKYDVSSNWMIETQVSGSKFEKNL